MNATASAQISGGNGQMSAFNLDLNFPSNIITTPVCAKDPRLPANHQVQANPNLAVGAQRLLLLDQTTYPVPTFTDGTILSCQAQILAGAAVGTYTLSATRTTAADGTGRQIPSTATNGSISVLSQGGFSCSLTTVPLEAQSVSDQVMLVSFPAALWLIRRRKRRALRSALLVLGSLLVAAVASAEWLAPTGGAWTLSTPGVPDPQVVAPPQGNNQPAFATQMKEALRRAGLSADAPVAGRSWHVRDLEVSGTTASGHIALVGASFLSVGRFRGTLQPGGRFAGVVTDDDGRELATVTAHLTAEGIQGGFTAVNGETGEWSWRAPGPAALQILRNSAGNGTPPGAR